MHTTATASCSASIFFHCSGDHRDLHSFPTRRSSDLPPEILLTGVIVNNQGERFVAEDSYHSRTSALDRKSTRLNSSHPSISYAVFCLKKKTNRMVTIPTLTTPSTAAHQFGSIARSAS